MILAGSWFHPSLQAEPVTYNIDPVHSTVGFKIRHLGISWVQGSFKDFDGVVIFDEENPDNSKIAVSVKAATVDTGNDDRDAHLQDEEYFNTAQWQTLSFKSKSVKKTGEKKYSVTGDFTLRGETKEMTFEITDLGTAKGMKGEMRRGGETEFTLKRSEFGMEGGLPLVGDEVHITLAFSAIQE